MPEPRRRGDDRGRGGGGHAGRPRRRADRDRRRGAGRWAASDGERVVTGDAPGPRSSWRERASRPAADRARREVAGRRRARRACSRSPRPAASTSKHDTMVAAYLIDPARRVYDARRAGRRRGPRGRASGGEQTRASSSLAAEEGEAGGRPAADARLVDRAGRPAARAARRVRARAPAARGRDAADRGPRRDGARRRQARRQAAGGDRRGDGRADRPARGRDLRARGPRVHDRLAAAARRGAVRRARPDQEAARQDGLLDRRPGARPDPRRARDRRQGRELARADEAQEHLPRRAARADRSRDRAHPHHLQPGRRRRPGACRASTRTSRTSRSAPRSAGRSAPASSPSAGMRLLSADYNQVELRVLAHVAGEDVLREIFASGEDVHAATAAEVLEHSDPRRSAPPSARRRRWSTTGSPTGCRPSGSRIGCRSPARRRRVYIERYFERFPAVKRFIDETIAKAERDGFVYTLMGRRRRDPGAALRAAPARARWASGWPSTR